MNKILLEIMIFRYGMRLYGPVIEIPFIDKSIIRVKCDEVINSDKVFCVPGKGMKSYANLYIRFRVKIS